MKVVCAFVIFTAAIFGSANAIEQVFDTVEEHLRLGQFGQVFASEKGFEQVFGVITPTDSILGLTTVQARFRLGQVVTADYTFTGATATARVVGIRVRDNKRMGKSPAVSITSGALGSATITLRFTSQRGFGINSEVTVYGTP
uniref:Probable salivary secreted peptide n=1 Tax=Zeugodacus cucurbitae TaxID=28588 RepID=A0A0A1XCF0_ZEUCU